MNIYLQACVILFDQQELPEPEGNQLIPDFIFLINENLLM